MNVYVVERCYDYEGCSVVKIFAIDEAAQAFAEKSNAEFGYTVSGPHGVTEWQVTENGGPDRGE